MKTEKWYDVQCEFCGRYLSTDFMCGMQRSSEKAKMYAKENGFKTKNGKNICPICLEKVKKCIIMPD